MALTQAEIAAIAEAVWQRVGSSSETMGKKLGDTDARTQNVEAAVGPMQQDLADIKAHLGI